MRGSRPHRDPPRGLHRRDAGRGISGLRHLPGRARTAALDSYIARIVDHDLPEAGLAVRHPTTVLAWLRAYAAAVGTSTSLEKIRNAAVTTT